MFLTLPPSQLYDENAELQDKLDKCEETVARLNRVIESFSTTVEERDAARQERNAALETLCSLRATLQMTPAKSTRNEHQPMEVDTDEGALTRTPPVSTQSSGHSLQRVPTCVHNSIAFAPILPTRLTYYTLYSVPDIAIAGPSTPRRNTTAQLLTPPPTEAQSRRRLTRTSVSLSYRDFEEQPEGRPMHSSEQPQAHGAPSEASGSHTQLVRRLFKAVCLRFRGIYLLRNRAPLYHQPGFLTSARSRSPTSS